MEAETFAEAAQIPLARADEWIDYITDAMDRYAIRTPMQQAAFIAQTGFETQSYQRWIENLRYSTPERIRSVWPYRFRSLDEARPYVRNEEGLANRVYANRNGNGDEHSGDGWLYRGRGLIQLTGKSNYRNAENGMGLALLAEPELLEEKEHAAASAAWWWYDQHLNHWADKGDIDAISGIINTGYPEKKAHGQDARREAYSHALFVLEG